MPSPYGPAAADSLESRGKRERRACHRMRGQRPGFCGLASPMSRANLERPLDISIARTEAAVIRHFQERQFDFGE
jgi:hypothetical protein